MNRLYKILEILIRIFFCVLVARLFEYHWLSKDHILGYLWILNHFRAKGEEIDGLYQRMQTEHYPTNRAILLNAYAALTLMFIQRKLGFLKPNSMWEILWHSLALCVLFANLHLPLMFMTHIHWQPYAHDHIHGFFILFSMNIILNIRLGNRYISCKSKDKIQ